MREKRTASSASEKASGCRIVLPVVMIGVAGFIDAVGFLTLGEVHVAFMSGNGSHLGTALVVQRWPTAQFVCLFIGMFVMGALVGSLIDNRPNDEPIKAVLVAELLVLAGSTMAAFCGLNVPALALASAAMGMQNVVHKHVAGIEVGRTAISGALVGLGQWLADLIQKPGSRTDLAPNALPVASFVAGTVFGAIAWGQIGLANALALATVVWLFVTTAALAGRV